MDEQTYRLAVELRDRLRAELAQNETFQAFQHAEAMVVMWERPHSKPAAAVAPASEKPGTSAVGRHLAGSQASRIVNGAQTYLRQKGGRAPASEIYKYLISQGVTVGGKAPLKTTASYLSHSPYFDNVPGQGYGPIEWSKGTEKSETPGSGELLGAPKTNGALPLNV